MLERSPSRVSQRPARSAPPLRRPQAGGAASFSLKQFLLQPGVLSADAVTVPDWIAAAGAPAETSGGGGGGGGGGGKAAGLSRAATVAIAVSASTAVAGACLVGMWLRARRLKAAGKAAGEACGREGDDDSDLVAAAKAELAPASGAAEAKATAAV